MLGHLSVFFVNNAYSILLLIFSVDYLSLIVDFYEFFIYSGYKSLITHMIYKYFSSILWVVFPLSQWFPLTHQSFILTKSF